MSIVHFVIKAPKLVQMTEYTVKKYPLSIQEGRQNSKMTATKFFFFFYISTSDGGDFPRIIEIALLYLFIIIHHREFFFRYYT